MDVSGSSKLGLCFQIEPREPSWLFGDTGSCLDLKEHSSRIKIRLEVVGRQVSCCRQKHKGQKSPVGRTTMLSGTGKLRESSQAVILFSKGYFY